MASPNTTELVVVRHGQTAWNRIGKQQGWLDSPLTGLGTTQAQAIADALVGERFDACYSSDLGRALQTAQIIAPRIGLEVIPEPGFRERNQGILQGMTMAEFEREHPAEYAHLRGADPDWAIPGGESTRQLYDRHISAAESLANRHSGARLLIVAHGGVLNSFFRRATGQGIASPRRFSLYNASINAFSITAERWTLLLWGDTHHLRHLATEDDW